MSCPLTSPPHRSSLWPLLLSVVLVACADDAPSPTPGGTTSPTSTDKEAPEGAVTYHRDVRPIFDRHCTSCHGDHERTDLSLVYSEADWKFRTPESISQAINRVRNEESSHWHVHDPSCAMQPSPPRALSDEEILTLAKWESDGKWQGKPEDYMPGSALFDRPEQAPALTFTIPEYLPKNDRQKDYRCFILEEALTQDTFINAVELAPGNAQIVDHITLIAINLPVESSDLLTIDRENREPGFPCFGQFGIAQQPRLLHSWTPGSPQGMRLPDSHAFVMPKGARLGMQVHYDPTRVKGKLKEAPKDTSSAKIWTTTAPLREARVLPFAGIRLAIPEEDNDYEDTFEFKMPYEGTVLGVTPHMLTLGTSYRMELVRMDAATSASPRCALDIPEWDFSTKQSYMFAQKDHVVLQKGDLWRQTCRYDNTVAHLPEINGAPRTPEEVFWGSTPGSEMCLSYALIAMDYVAELPPVDCSIVTDCLQTCKTNDLKCFALCSGETSGDCTQCAFTELVECGGRKCGNVGLELAKCLQVCDLTNGYGLYCIEKNCAYEWQEFSNCGVEKFNDGTCKLDTCE